MICRSFADVGSPAHRKTSPRFPTLPKPAPSWRMAKGLKRKSPHRLRRRPPFFHPAPLRARHDGWSEARQCHSLAQLYLTGSVGAAARAVGMSRASAYRLRERAGGEDFAFAWDSVLTPPGAGRIARPRRDWRKVTNLELVRRIESGLIQPVIYRGRMTAIRRKPCNSVLFQLLRRTGAVPQSKGASL